MRAEKRNRVTGVCTKVRVCVFPSVEITDEVRFGVAMCDVDGEGGALDGADTDGTGRALRNTQFLHVVSTRFSNISREVRPSVNN